MPQPFLFDELALSNLLEEFANVVLVGKVKKRLRIVIEGLNADFLPIIFDEGTVIQRITEEELWVLGDYENLEHLNIRFPAYYPDSEWKILDIERQYNREKEIPGDINLQFNREKEISDAAYTVFDAVLSSLRLGSSGRLRFINLGSQNNFGINSIGHLVSQDRVPQELGIYEGIYSLNDEMIHNLQNHWLKVRSIIESDSHYLRLPAMRLIDGGSRNQPRNALIDYAIGLESLLTGGEEKELAYKFALRGATILSWDEGGRRDFYNNLQSIYKLRSSIVHGNHRIPKKNLTIEDACHMGESYLRKIWWWYFTRNILNINNGIDIINNRILDP